MPKQTTLFEVMKPLGARASEKDSRCAAVIDEPFAEGMLAARRSVLVVALLAGALGACGEDGDGPTPTSSSSGSSGSPSPTCATPATLTPPEPKSSRFIVTFKETTTDVDARITALETKYGFTASRRFEAFKQFVASLTKEQVAGLRCEPDVAALDEDQAEPAGG